MKKLVAILCFIITCTASLAAEMTPSQQANVYYSQNDIKKAFEILSTIAEGDRTAQDWLILGNILQDEGKTPEAIFMFKRATLVDDKFYRAYYNLGNIYLDEERPYLAIDEYKKVLRINREFAYAYYNIGCAYIKAGNLKKARTFFLKAIELKNTEPSFYYNAAYVYKKLGNEKKAKQYLDFYNKAIEN